jgi:hypothetical protein
MMLAGSRDQCTIHLIPDEVLHRIVAFLSIRVAKIVLGARRSTTQWWRLQLGYPLSLPGEDDPVNGFALWLHRTDGHFEMRSIANQSATANADGGVTATQEYNLSLSDMDNDQTVAELRMKMYRLMFSYKKLNFVGLGSTQTLDRIRAHFAASSTLRPEGNVLAAVEHMCQQVGVLGCLPVHCSLASLRGLLHSLAPVSRPATHCALGLAARSCCYGLTPVQAEEEGEPDAKFWAGEPRYALFTFDSPR